MNRSAKHLRQLCIMALICAMAFIAVSLIRIPVVAFLKYEPKDVFLVIGGFLLGPIAGAIMSAVVGLIELAISDTGLIGMVMNILSSCFFVCTASFIYHRKKTLGGALAGLVTAALVTTGLMLLWNYLITPLYMGIPRESVAEMLIPMFLPFNLLKYSLNAALTMFLYKPFSMALRAARLLPESESKSSSYRTLQVAAGSLFVLITLLLVLLAWNGILF